MLPDYMKKYFWDCDFESLDWNRYRRFITERVLNLGDDKSVAWIRGQVDDLFLKELVLSSRELDPKTRNYWRLILGI